MQLLRDVKEFSILHLQFNFQLAIQRYMHFAKLEPIRPAIYVMEFEIFDMLCGLIFLRTCYITVLWKNIAFSLALLHDNMFLYA